MALLPRSDSPRSARRHARRAERRKAREQLADLPGPSPNAATNLLIGDIATRGAALLVARAVERMVLRTRIDRERAEAIVKGRTMAQTLAATGAARIASRSIPGLLLVGGGLFAKVLLDRSSLHRTSRRKGGEALAEQAKRGRED